MTQEIIDSIHYNLNLFGFEDMVVVGSVQITRDGANLREEKTQPLWLSVICARHRQLLTEVEHNPKEWEKANAGIKILGVRPHKPIGRVNDCGHFYYDKAPSLEMALGWLIATSLGRSVHITSYNLGKYAEEICKGMKKGKLTDKLLSKVLRHNSGNKDVSLGLAREMFSGIVGRR